MYVYKYKVQDDDYFLCSAGYFRGALPVVLPLLHLQPFPPICKGGPSPVSIPSLYFFFFSFLLVHLHNLLLPHKTSALPLSILASTFVYLFSLYVPSIPFLRQFLFPFPYLNLLSFFSPSSSFCLLFLLPSFSQFHPLT